MQFLIQTDANGQFKDVNTLTVFNIVKDLTKIQPYSSYTQLPYPTYAMNNFLSETESWPKDFKSYIPIGDINFTNNWFETFYNKKLKPYTVPNVINNPNIMGLERNYEIINNCSEYVTEECFLQDAENIKGFTFKGILTKEEAEKINLLKTKIIASNYLDIKSEWRFFIHKGTIKYFGYKKGDILRLPLMSTVKESIKSYESWVPDENKLDSYIMDFAYTEQGATVLIKIAPVLTANLYGFKDPILLDMYKNNIDFLIK